MKNLNQKWLNAKLLHILPVILLLSCSGSKTPTPASMSLIPLTQNPFCEAGSIGEMCRDTKAKFYINVLANKNNQFNTWGVYSSSNTLSNGSLLSGGTSNEKLTIGNSATNDNLGFNVPISLSYDINMCYIQYGASKPLPSNANCANPVSNNQSGCFRWDKMLSFKKKVIPNASSLAVDFNLVPCGGNQISCTLF